MEIQSYLNIEYAEASGKALLLDIYRPDDELFHPILMNVHGGGWSLGGRSSDSEFFRNYVEHGFVVVDIDYRLAPEHPYPAAIDDLRTAAQWLLANAQTYGGDATQFAAIGHSAGGHLLELLATDDNTPLTCAVCWGNPTDMRREPVTHPNRGYAWAFMSACPNEQAVLYAEASPVTRLSAQTPPILHIHGTADEVVPVHHAQLLADAAARVGAPVEILILEGGGHCVAGNEENRMQVDNSIWNFFAKYFLPRTTEFFKRSGDRTQFALSDLEPQDNQ